MKVLQSDKTPSNECPAYDTKISDGEVQVMLSSGKCGVVLTVIASRSTLVLNGQIEINCVFMLNGIV